jgi:hypothetical protein
MKKPLFLLSLLSIACHLQAQTAEDILFKTQNAYRGLENYTDEGQYITESYSPPPGDTRSTTYFMAMDRKSNIHFWHHDDQSDHKGGSSYIKSAKDTIGYFKRLNSDDPPLPETISFAAARSGGRGGPMFYTMGSLFYDDFFGTGSDTSQLLRYDWTKRLSDTVIAGMTCYVILAENTTYISQEYADQQNFKRDSTQGLLDLPVEQRGGNRMIAGPRVTETKTYIRKNDFMVVMQVTKHFKEGTNQVRVKNTLTLNPKTNVRDFKTYLATSAD